jgi:hypothetical protein
MVTWETDIIKVDANEIMMAGVYTDSTDYS